MAEVNFSMDAERMVTTELQPSDRMDFLDRTALEVPENMTRIMDMHLQLIAAEKKFRRACKQIMTLNHKMNGMVERYKRAKAENRRSFRYTLRLQLAVVEGVRNMYHDYAQEQAVTVTKLRGELYGEEQTDDDSEDESEDGMEVLLSDDDES